MIAGDSQTLRKKRHFVISVIAINVFYCSYIPDYLYEQCLPIQHMYNLHLYLEYHVARIASYYTCIMALYHQQLNCGNYFLKKIRTH